MSHDNTLNLKLLANTYFPIDGNVWLRHHCSSPARATDLYSFVSYIHTISETLFLVKCFMFFHSIITLQSSRNQRGQSSITSVLLTCVEHSTLYQKLCQPPKVKQGNIQLYVVRFCDATRENTLFCFIYTGARYTCYQITYTKCLNKTDTVNFLYYSVYPY